MRICRRVMIMIIVLSVFLTACGGRGNVDEPQNKMEHMRHVMFKNTYIQVAVTDIEPTKNRIISTYESKKDAQLYAFCIEPVYNSRYDEMTTLEQKEYKKKLVKDIVEEFDFLLLEGYDEELCAGVIIGTLEKIDEVFNETDAINGEYWTVFAAHRPDWKDIMLDLGWNGTDEIHTESMFFIRNEIEIRKIIGEEAEIDLLIEIFK